MKKTLKYSLSLFLLTAVLFSTFGFSLNKMHCLESGNVVYSFFETEDCCLPNEKTETTIDIQCCEFSKIIFQSSISEILKQEFFKKISLVIFSSSLPIYQFTNLPISIFSFFTDTSPPLTASEFLSLISVFRI